MLDILSTIDRASKDLKAVALNFQQQGKVIPNRKIVRRVTHRKIANEEALLASLDANPAIGEALYVDRKLKSIGKLLKLNSKSVNDSLTKPEGGLEVVHMNDSRPAVSTASEHFNKNI
jgi:hypothetical protein